MDFQSIVVEYSGHGYFQPDFSGDEEDRVDETLVSYDTVVKQDESIANMITDDEIGGFLQKGYPWAHSHFPGYAANCEMCEFAISFSWFHRPAL